MEKWPSYPFQKNIGSWSSLTYPSGKAKHNLFHITGWQKRLEVVCVIKPWALASAEIHKHVNSYENLRQQNLVLNVPGETTESLVLVTLLSVLIVELTLSFLTWFKGFTGLEVLGSFFSSLFGFVGFGLSAFAFLDS